MTGQSLGGRPRSTPLAAALTGAALLAVPSTIAAPAREIRDAPAPVTSIGREQLEAVPANRDLRSILEVHNQLRARNGARPLRWNPVLAANAERYAHTLAALGTVQHASRVGRENERENIVVGPRSGVSPVDLVQIWVREGRLFRPGTYPGVCAGDWSKCSHFTQMIWPTTTDLGCGYVRGRFDALVCRYSPPGNKDGVYLGPTQVRDRPRAEGLCTNASGMTIPCQNAPGGTPVEDGGGGDQDSGVKEEVACVVDVNVHKPISVAPDEPVLADADELPKGAITLRNDDSDWMLRDDGGTGTLPIVSLRSDLDRSGNANENDLVKVIARNPNRLPGVYLFAFPTHAETSRALGAKVDAVTDGLHATADELDYFKGPTKAEDSADLPLLIPAAETMWVEGKLGGRYRMVIGKLLDQVAPADVRYDASTGQAYVGKAADRKPAFLCEDQATVTAAVVDIFQQNIDEKSLRLTAFDVYWGARPHFRAEVWPGGGSYAWGAKYRLGAAEHSMPGTAVNDDYVAFMLRDDEDVEGDNNARENGPKVDATGTARGNLTTKGRIQGGFQIDRPGGDNPVVDASRTNRYPKRVSLAYQVGDDTLVRPEYLEVILPLVRTPAASGPDAGSVRVVESKVEYVIVDAFDREIKAERISDYLHLYGAGMKAWEALGEQAGRVLESGPLRDGYPVDDDYRDHVYLTASGVDNRGEARPPIGPLGTAQRSQTRVRDDRMTRARFKDTLVFTAPSDADDRAAMWRAARRLDTLESLEQAAAEANARDDALNNRADPREQKLKPRERRAAEQRRREAVPGADARRIVSAPLLAIPQDVILQMRVGAERNDLMVLQGNTLSVFAPFFFNDNKYQGNKDDPVFRFHISFTPGTVVSQLVRPPHRRPPKGRPQRRR